MSIYLLIYVSYGFTLFFESKNMILKDFLNILNVIIWRLENFLRGFLKNFTSKLSIFEAYANLILRADFSKFQTLLCFLSYNLFDTSYDSHFFSSVKTSKYFKLGHIICRKFSKSLWKEVFSHQTNFFVAYAKQILRVDSSQTRINLVSLRCKGS